MCRVLLDKGVDLLLGMSAGGGCFVQMVVGALRCCGEEEDGSSLWSQIMDVPSSSSRFSRHVCARERRFENSWSLLNLGGYLKVELP